MALAMVLDHAGALQPARDKVAVKLPREAKLEIVPPTAEHVLAVQALLPERYKLALVVLYATGMRLGELQGLTWGDVDEGRSRWRVSQVRLEDEPRPVGKRSAGCVRGGARPVPARRSRPSAASLSGLRRDRFRTAITRACTAADVRPSRRTTCGIAGSRSCTSRACREAPDRRGGRAALTSCDLRHVLARPGRRDRARLRNNTRVCETERQREQVTRGWIEVWRRDDGARDSAWEPYEGDPEPAITYTPGDRLRSSDLRTAYDAEHLLAWAALGQAPNRTLRGVSKGGFRARLRSHGAYLGAYLSEKIFRLARLFDSWQGTRLQWSRSCLCSSRHWAW